jgi:hypothetical protein
MLKPKPEQDEKGRFISGTSGGGRPRGSRNLLGEAFVADLYADWQKHGPVTITKVRKTRPSDYLRLIASILPKDVNVNVTAAESMSDDELSATIKRLLAEPDLELADPRETPGNGGGLN